MEVSAALLIDLVHQFRNLFLHRHKSSLHPHNFLLCQRRSMTKYFRGACVNRTFISRISLENHLDLEGRRGLVSLERQFGLQGKPAQRIRSARFWQVLQHFDGKAVPTNSVHHFILQMFMNFYTWKPCLQFTSSARLLDTPTADLQESIVHIRPRICTSTLKICMPRKTKSKSYLRTYCVTC